jgi:RNA polymerase sigma-70 factor (ECF subfamily)
MAKSALEQYMVASALPISLFGSNRALASERQSLAASAQSMQDDVLALAQAGDEDAFSKLYMQYKRRVISTCMQMVHNFSQTEDLTQETFLQVHLKLNTFRGDSAFATWLHRIAVNIVLMYLRKRALPVVSLDELTTNVPGEHFGRDLGTRDLTQTGVIDRLAIDRAVVHLAPGYRRIFLLHDVHGFQHSEIASMLDCTPGCSKSQLHKARRSLRCALSSRSPADHSLNRDATSKLTAN